MMAPVSGDTCRWHAALASLSPRSIGSQGRDPVHPRKDRVSSSIWDGAEYARESAHEGQGGIDSSQRGWCAG